MSTAPEASPELKRHAAHTSDDARSTVWQAAEELEEVPAMARGGGGEERSGVGGDGEERMGVGDNGVLG
jgi:hypothetical protein